MFRTIHCWDRANNFSFQLAEFVCFVKVKSFKNLLIDLKSRAIKHKQRRSINVLKINRKTCYSKARGTGIIHVNTYYRYIVHVHTRVRVYLNVFGSFADPRESSTASAVGQLLNRPSNDARLTQITCNPPSVYRSICVCDDTRVLIVCVSDGPPGKGGRPYKLNTRVQRAPSERHVFQTNFSFILEVIRTRLIRFTKIWFGGVGDNVAVLCNQRTTAGPLNITP